MNKMSNIALIIAGGVGRRFHNLIPKQFITVFDKPVIIYTLECFQKHPSIDEICVVCLNDWINFLEVYSSQFHISKLKHIVKGGENGQESIRMGLNCLKHFYDLDDIVLIHDAIRPNVSSDIISNCINCVKNKGSVVTAIPCNEAMMISSNDVFSDKAYPRNQLKRTQTPQGAHLGDLIKLHEYAEEHSIRNSVATCTLMTECGRRIFFSPGSSKNIKITTPEDLDIFKSLIKTENL